jgi:chromosome segregation ATPase
MFKKVLIAALAVVVGLAVVKGTWLGSYMRFNCTKIRHWAEERIPPEQEIQRLRMELATLARDDDRFYDKVARMAVDVEKQEAEVARLRTNLSREESHIRTLKAAATENAAVEDRDNGSRAELRIRALAFKNAEESLKSKEGALAARKKHLALERKKLAELQSKRDQMSTELQRLETALAEEREAQAASESTIDDSSYRRMRKDIDSIRDRINVLKKKRELRGEFNPSVGAKESEQDAQADKYLQTRFGDKKEVAAEKSEK